MAVLVLGGTGAIGSHVVSILSQNNQEVFVTSRFFREDTCNVHYIKGNAKDVAFLKRLLNQKHWSTIIDFMSYNTSEFSEKYNDFLDSCEQYIFISSSRVYANSNIPLQEDSPRLLDCVKDNTYLATDEYALSKARQENFLFNSKKRNWTIIRPYITYDKNRLQLGVLEKEEWLYRAIYGRPIVFCEEISSKQTTFTNGYDVALGISKMIGNNNCFGEAYHLTASKSKTWGDLLNIYKEVFYKCYGLYPEIKMVSLEAFLNCRSQSLYYQVVYDRLYNRVFDTSKSNKIIDVDKFIEPNEGILECMSEFLLSPSFKGIDWIHEGVKDKLCHCFAHLSEFPKTIDFLRYIKSRI